MNHDFLLRSDFRTACRHGFPHPTCVGRSLDFLLMKIASFYFVYRKGPRLNK